MFSKRYTAFQDTDLASLSPTAQGNASFFLLLPTVEELKNANFVWSVLA
jgi:hypothetical protein